MHSWHPETKPNRGQDAGREEVAPGIQLKGLFGTVRSNFLQLQKNLGVPSLGDF